MRKYQSREFYKRPLTSEEAQFAEDHLGLVYWFLKRKKLNPDEWMDVIVFGYMLAVKKYVSIAETRKYPFHNTACLEMRASLANELRKQKKQIPTISLYNSIAGRDDLIYLNTITTENLNFVPYLYAGGEDMKITYNVQVPEKIRRGAHKCEEIIAIEEFLQGKEENMCFEYETQGEARQRASTICAHRKRLAKLHIYYDACQMANCIYIMKAQSKEVSKSEAR